MAQIASFSFVATITKSLSRTISYLFKQLGDIISKKNGFSYPTFPYKREILRRSNSCHFFKYLHVKVDHTLPPNVPRGHQFSECVETGEKNWGPYHIHSD